MVHLSPCEPSAQERRQMQESSVAIAVEATARTPCRGWELFGPGEQPDEVSAGDLLFRAGNQHWMSVAISCGQLVRSETRRYARWNHVMLILDGGRTAHATGRGLVEGELAELHDATYALVRLDCSDGDRRQIVAFADDQLRRHPTWGWLTAGSQLFSLLTGSRVVIGKLGTITCSGFAAEALLRAGAIFDRPAHMMSPADLAKECGLPGVVRLRDVPPAAMRVYTTLKRVNGRPSPDGSADS
jgi:hypothetical protein